MLGAALAAVLVLAASKPVKAAGSRLTPVPLPGAGGGVGFDDLGYASSLGKVLVPGGRTGKLYLIEPRSRRVRAIGGFSAHASYDGGHDEGVTSADEGAGLLFAADRDARTLDVVDPAKRAVVASVKLAGGPDYVRYCAPTREVWVTEPGSERIEIFSLSTGAAPALRKTGELAVPGGPESLVIDAARGRAWTNSWGGRTYAVGLKRRRILARWDNGCRGSRGLALDEGRGWVFVGCAEGKAVVLDAARGAVLSSLASGKGVDIIAYSPRARRLYLPGARSATLAVMSVSASGALSLLRVLPTARGSHCAAADGQGGVWICDPDRGRLLYLDDRDQRSQR